MIIQTGNAQSRAWWVPARKHATDVVKGVLAVALATPVVAHFDKAHLSETHRQATLAQLNDEWSRSIVPCAAEAERLLKRGLAKRTGRQGRKPYELRISSPTDESEAKIWCIVGYFERVGLSLAADHVPVDDLARIHRHTWRRWIALLKPLLDTKQLTLDEARREQVARAVAALHAVCDDDAETRFARQRWTRLTLSGERLEPSGDGRTYVNARIQNPNSSPAPAPAVRVVARADDGVVTGSWIIVPSDAHVPAFGEIELGAHIHTEDRGVASGVGLEGDLAWLADALSAPERFPAPARQTQLLQDGQPW